ncbi:hypothetical protein ABZV94_32725, partial [Streptomyces sp. NPDC004658]
MSVTPPALTGLVAAVLADDGTAAWAGAVPRRVTALLDALPGPAATNTAIRHWLRLGRQARPRLPADSRLRTAHLP